MGLVSAALVLIGFFTVLLRAGWSPGADVGSGSPLHDGYVTATAMTFAGIVACQIGTAMASRTERASLREVGFATNPLLLWGILFEILIAAAIIYLPPLQPIFHTAPLGAFELALLAPSRSSSGAVTSSGGLAAPSDERGRDREVDDHREQVLDHRRERSRPVGGIAAGPGERVRQRHRDDGRDRKAVIGRGQLYGCGTTTTGAGAWCETCWLTEPSRRPVKPPRRGCRLRAGRRPSSVEERVRRGAHRCD